MAERDHCSACASLKEYAPQVVRRGITKAVCESLRSNEGLNLTLQNHDNCEGLNDLLSCLIGNLHERLPSFGICDWREFMDELMRNLFVLQDAMICSECGQWDKLGEQDERLNNIENRLTHVERILSAILAQMRVSGAWTTGSPSTVINLTGAPSANVNLAAGNINLFSGANATGANPTNFIRTRAGINNNDLAGGV